MSDNQNLFTRSFVILIMAIAFSSGILVHKLWIKPTTAKQAAALAGTNQTQFEQFKDGSAKAAGHTPTQATITKIVSISMPAAAKEVKRQGGTIVAVLQASGESKSSRSELLSVPTLPGLTGAWSGTVKQDRGGLPALTSVHFLYAPETGLQTAWENKPEIFRQTLAISENPDGSRQGFSRLIRIVDGVEEPIKTTGSDFYIPASEVTRFEPLACGDVGIGPFLDQHAGKTRILLYTSKRWSKSLSTGGFYVPGVGYALIITHTFGGSK